MGKKIIDEKLGKEIINMYLNGISPEKIVSKFGGSPSSSTIREYLKENNISSSFKNKYSDEDKRIIGELYSANKIDDIFKLYPNIQMSSIYTYASQKGYKKENYFWTKDDTDYLINNYDKYSLGELEQYYNGKHTKGAISAKAIKMGLTSSQDWTNEENQILIENYSKKSIDDMMKMLPNRTYNAIIGHAKVLKLKSFRYLNERYTDEQKIFIINNWEKMSDEQMANELGKSVSGIMEQRHKMDLYKINRNYGNYENFSKLFRGHIQEWKTETMNRCNYCCVFTQSKDFAIHHLYSFNKILEEAFNEITKEIDIVSYDISDYSKDELDRMIQIFCTVHNKYPLGVCVRKDIHDLFHKIYGAGGNTEAQWNQFAQDLRNNKYSDLIEI